MYKKAYLEALEAEAQLEIQKEIVQEQLMEDAVGNTDVEEFEDELEEDDCHQKLVTNDQKKERQKIVLKFRLPEKMSRVP